MPISRFYLVSVGVLLVGYALFDRGFAYFGYPPLFIGEIFIGFSFFILLAGGYSQRVFNSPIVWILLIFMAWGAVRTVPFITDYGMNALRDAVLWGYGLYALFVAAALLRCRDLVQVPRWFSAWFPYFLVLSPIFFLITQKFQYISPTMPGGGAHIINMKPGDMNVHLAGIGAFLALGLHRQFLKAGKKLSQAKEFGLWAIWAMDVIAAGSRNRGGLMSVLMACLLIFIFKPASRLNRIILPLLIVVLVAVAFDLKVPIQGGRSVSVQQIVSNVQSVFVRSDKTVLRETNSWRIQWWTRITDETFNGEYFLAGRGYGVSLATVHGFDDGTGNRSPHNGHLTILARSGVPGFILWIVLISSVFLFLLQGYFRMRALGHDAYANLNLWLMAYGLAFLVNSSFDVYLEGPQGGIWFWCIVGFAVAITEEQRLLHMSAVAAYRQSGMMTASRLR